MANKSSITVDEVGGEDNVEHTSNAFKGATLRRRANIKMVQNILLIWLDNNIDEENSADVLNTVTQLRRIVNTIEVFTDSNQCIEFLEENNNEKVCMIISGSLGQYIVPCIHNMIQVDSIFIFCENKKYHEQWAGEWSKIKGVFTDISPICKALKETAQQCEHNSILINFMTTNSDAINKKIDHLDCSFMYTEILKEILLSIKFEKNHIEEFIIYCQDAFTDNEEELIKVKELKQKYHDKTPIWWYTCESFLYPMLNRALRLMDVDMIIRTGFFIGDLHRHIEQLYLEQYKGHYSSETFIVYRGQGIQKDDFDKMTKTMGGLISFNNFLSTSKDSRVSFKFARNVLRNPDLIGILFIMTIDPSISSTPFASINTISYFQEEDEILFSMHTVFRINDIKRLDENHRLFQVKLTLTSDNDKDLRMLADRIREDTQGSTGWHQLGELLFKMGCPQKAEEVYEVLLDQTTDERETGYIYNQLGKIKYNQGEYQEAIRFCEKSLKIYKKTLTLDHPDSAKPYNNIGNVYYNMGKYMKALSYYVKTLEIYKKTLPSNHLDMASIYNNIGNAYANMKEYSKAFSFHKQALVIRQQLLPSNHCDLAVSYNNIGMLYQNVGKYSKALSFYEKALEIEQQSLPPNHHDLSASYNNIGGVYYHMHEYAKTLSFYEKALAIKQQSLDPNHPDLAMSYYNIGLVYQIMHDYSQARSYYQRSVDIGQHSLPSNHPHLQQYRKKLHSVK